MKHYAICSYCSWYGFTRKNECPNCSECGRALDSLVFDLSRDPWFTKLVRWVQ